MQKIRFFFIILLSLPLSLKGQDFEVAPVKMKFSVDPEETQTKILTVKNHSNFRTSFTISFADYILDKNGNKEFINKNSTKTTCSEWMTPEKSFFDVNPNEQIEIKIAMQAPIDDYSTRWAVMYIQTVKEKTSFDVDKGMGAGVKVSGRIAVDIVRESLVPAKPKLKIKDLREVAGKDSAHHHFLVDVLNVGESIAECKLVFIASNLNSAEEIEFEPIHFVSYPGFTREVKFDLLKALPTGKYSLIALLDYGKDITIEGARLKEPLLIVRQNE